MNICAKINSMAQPNGIVISGDLYQIVKSFSFIDKYQFRESRGYSIGFSQWYPVYTALSKNTAAGMDINSINQIFRSPETPKIKDIRSQTTIHNCRSRANRSSSKNILPISWL